MSADDYMAVIQSLKTGTVSEWEEFAEILDGFPDGKDTYIDDHWLNHALSLGRKEAVEWMVAVKKVNLDFCDAGYTPVLSVLEREDADRYDLLTLLLEHGADINAKGSNDWTPLHHAAVQEDLRGLEILLAHGADLSIRTDIDDYATPLEEARNLKKTKAVAFLERYLNEKI